MKVLSEVFDTFICEEIVIPLPAEIFSDVASGSQRLSQLDDSQIGDIDESMLGGMEIFLCAKNSLVEEVAIYGKAILLWDEHSW